MGWGFFLVLFRKSVQLLFKCKPNVLKKLSEVNVSKEPDQPVEVK